MKKIILSITLCFLLVIYLTVTPYAATNLGMLSYWHSNSERIGRWDGESVDIYLIKLNPNTSFYFTNGMTHACREWDDVIGMTLNRYTSNSSSPIRFYGGTIDEINRQTEFRVDNSVNGKTRWVVSSVEGIWQYGSMFKTQREITEVVGCVLDKGHTIDEYRNTCTHELGHALGWDGHSYDSSDVMYSMGASVTSLTVRDKNHLSQVY